MTPDLALVAALTALLALGLAAAVLLRGWQGWLALRREQLLSGSGEPAARDLTELKRRVRKLEAIASGTE